MSAVIKKFEKFKVKKKRVFVHMPVIKYHKLFKIQFTMASKSLIYSWINLSFFYREKHKIGISVLKCCGTNSVVNTLNTGILEAGKWHLSTLHISGKRMNIFGHK